MGRKGRWFDAVQRILTTSEPDREEKESKAERPANKSSFRKIWQFSKSGPSNPSSPAAPETAPAAQQEPPSLPDKQEAEEIREAESAGTTSEQNDGRYPVAELSSSVAATATAVAAQAAEAVASVVAVTPRTQARSKEELAVVRIQTACRGYLARRGHQARGQARLMELMEGIAVKRQTEEALYCMQTMTRVQTQINSRRAKTEEDKKALKSQIQQKQALDKAKIGEGWDHSHQSKEQLEALQATKQEAASRRQRAMSYAFSRQWRNRSNPSASGRGATTPTHAPTFMDPGCPNWGWSIAERSMAAARPWEMQTTPQGKDRAPAKSAAGVRTAKPRVSISIQIPPPTTPPGSRSARPPPGWPSPSTPTRPRSPSVLGRAPSPRGSPLHRSTSGLSERPRSSQEHLGSGSSSPIQGGKEQQQGPLSLRRTTSLRSGELPRRLSLGARADADASEAGGAPVTPSYMQPTKSVRAKARGSASPAAGDRAAEFPPEKAPPVSSPSVKKRLPIEFAEKGSAPPSSPRKVKAERAKRPSQPPVPGCR